MATERAYSGYPRLTNLLVLQDELVAHLKAELADIRPAVHVLAPSEMNSRTASGIETAWTQPTPAVNVVFLGIRPGTDDNQQLNTGRGLVMQQLFVAEVVTRNVRDLRSGAAARNEAGELAAAVMLALMATKLPSATGVIKILPGPGPVYQNGNQYLPIAIETTLQVVKA